MVSFSVTPGDPASACVLHVPHASSRIPEALRADLMLDEPALHAEFLAMTDRHTDAVARRASELVGGPAPWAFVNHLSRLVVDPERFPDEREEMNAVGMGVVYTRTSGGDLLRRDDPGRRADLIAAVFDPYSRALADLVDARLAATGRAVIVDLHSFPKEPLPYELHANGTRPLICLGTDAAHTPAGLLEDAHAAFAGLGDVAVNEPFRGTYVPLRHYGVDARVSSVMVEFRRDLLQREDGSRIDEGVEMAARATAALVDAVSARA